jgi:ABC-2 type transport system permease protein
MAGALNTAPIAWLAVGAAALAVGWLPSAVGAIGALPVVGGFLLNVITQGTQAPAWVVNLSPFAHVSAVPSLPPDWVAIAALIVIGMLMAALGVAGYFGRDLTT